MECIFCDILDGKRDGHILYEDEAHVSFLDRFPIDTGHSLVIPRAHHERITDMEPEDVGRLFTLVPRIASAVVGAMSADAFSLGQNNGRAARQVVPHVHVHIIPRYNGKKTEWMTRQSPTEEELADIAGRVRSRLSRLSRGGPGCT